MGEDLQHVYIYFNDLERQSLLGLVLILLVIIVFLVLIFIRFLFHQGSLPDLPITMARTTTTSSYSQNNNGGLSSCPSLGLDAEKINSLPIFTHKFHESSDDENSNNSSSRSRSSSTSTSNFMESECSICLGTFEDDEILKLMPECLHVFHSECVDKWLSSSSTCPLCRSSI